MTSPSPLVQPPDGGWGWVVMMASFFNSAAIFGVLKSGGVMYVAIMHIFQKSPMEAAFVPSLAFSLSCILAPVSSSLCTRYTFRSVVFFGALVSAVGVAMSAVTLSSFTIFTICYGGIMGLGFGLVLVPNIIVVHTYFDRHRAFASGFALAGGSVGCFIFPPLLEYVLDEHGTTAALLALSAILLHICPGALLFRPLVARAPKYSRTPPSDDHAEKELIFVDVIKNGYDCPVEPESVPEKTKERRSVFRKLLELANIDPSIFREKYFYLSSVTLMLFTYVWSGYLTLLPHYAVHEASEPISPTMAAMLLSFMSIGDVVFRVVGGWLMDRSWINRRLAYLAFLLASSALLFAYTFRHSYVGLVVISVAFGGFISGVIILPPVLLVDLLGQRRFPMAFGICAAIDGLVVTFAAPTLAYIKARTGSYKLCFLVMALCLLCGAVAWAVDAVYVWLRPQPKTKECLELNNITN